MVKGVSTHRLRRIWVSAAVSEQKIKERNNNNNKIKKNLVTNFHFSLLISKMLFFLNSLVSSLTHRIISGLKAMVCSAQSKSGFHVCVISNLQPVNWHYSSSYTFNYRPASADCRVSTINSPERGNEIIITDDFSDGLDGSSSTDRNVVSGVALELMMWLDWITGLIR